MKSPDLYNFTRRTREQIEASFQPCPICGRIEQQTTVGVYRIEHDLEKHGLARPNELRREA